MARENLAAALDRFADGFARSIRSQSIGDDFRDLLPRRGFYFGVDTAVGKDLHTVLAQ
jgi:hypothetical protein